MPSTYGQIKSALPQFGRIDDPQWNIAAGILHDHDLWVLWNRDVPEDQRWAFMIEVNGVAAISTPVSRQ